ncbi:HEXXH motif-containing putative peptide modification protein [Streptomyces sp. TLI_146]|uniref:HEXXH motif-containing putative peptide modification protein n=1 Tax=Streptomyces sp. TLI_146 TaxID=1938858 RepID=UPI0015D602E9|nr:HEXXH motif-containing putative peptide modification protein [Streptomyces sp. TLI_146]
MNASPYSSWLLVFDNGRDERYYFPWRGDPRPLADLLQGTYGLTAIVKMHRGEGGT